MSGEGMYPALVSWQVMLRVRGQADFRSSAAVRDAAPVPDAEAARRVLTVLGRTGALVGMYLVRNEAGPVIRDTLQSMWPQYCCDQVTSVASDQCSGALFEYLQEVFPNLDYLSLDPVHLPIAYEYAHGNKRSPGSRVLRLIMAKLTKVRSDLPSDHWGPPHTGKEVVVFSSSENDARSQILHSSMGEKHARNVLHHLDGDMPWATVLDFMKALAALSKIYSVEMKRTTADGSTLRRLLFNATSQHKLHFYFNNQRHRHSMPTSKLSLMSSGTSGNETVHRDINQWCRNGAEWFSTTAELHFSINRFGRLLSHNTALYSPTLRQLRQSDVLARAAASMAIPSADWSSYCGLLRREGADLLAPASLPLFQERQGIKRKIERARNNSVETALRKPAAVKRPAAVREPDVLKRSAVRAPPKKKSAKRTVFSLRRAKQVA